MSRTIGLKLAVVAFCAVPLVVALHGCTSECVDKYDCRQYETINPDGTRNLYTCVSNACVAGDPGGYGEPGGGGEGGGTGGGDPGDAGEGGGAGGGSGGGTSDGGTDAG